MNPSSGSRRLLRVWYVSAQRLCNFDCSYCVSTGTWSKSRKHNWQDPGDLDRFKAVVRWIGTRPQPVAVRLGSLGEPFASNEFLTEAGWLTRQSGVRYVELVSNGSLLERRLPRLDKDANLAKLSLWLTYHDGQIPLERFIRNARFAQEEFGCFVVVNALLFPGNAQMVREVGDAAREAGLRFNLDLGYDPQAPSDDFDYSTAGPDRAVPVLRDPDVLDEVARLGGETDLTRTALLALRNPLGEMCSAGHDSIFIGIDGEVYPCSRYHVLEQGRLGNILDPDFRLDLRTEQWSGCRAENGCCNKEDFLNLRQAGGLRPEIVPSLGWVDA
ncbi:radical SAM protein [Streptomyces genisteinicus]|uniref:Radical SAM protein n=1 Tax=Streptomyces genisteinicus TaxID=2768068 RepID=A0A7H0HZ69_9ACTN|nr:radical SAM protein [Streptomyces genisteinicus]QNP65835.1 radical SAM protein [Streptomyces genisteinicus]